MPGGDGTGPLGNGSRGFRGGICGGLGMGNRGGYAGGMGRGMGRRMRRRFFQGTPVAPGWGQRSFVPNRVPQNPVSPKESLEAEIADTEAALEAMRAELKDY